MFNDKFQFQSSSIPSGLVATEYDPMRCTPQLAGAPRYGAMFLTRPQTNMWICAWAADALADGFVITESQVNAPNCGAGTASRIVKL